MDGEQPRPGNFADEQRRHAAMLAAMAADCDDDLRGLQRLAERERRTLPAFGIEPGAEHLAEMVRTQRDGVELLQQLAAAQAIAYDEMIAAGGQDNAEAYEKYRQATQRHIALMPRFETGE